ncbi:MAG: efflux RND transporter permease subunit [Crocinitomicaceae bacterium]
MTSTSSNNGTASISIYFKLGNHVDMAAVNVQNRVARALPLLPQRRQAKKAGVVTSKRQSDNILIFDLNSSNPEYDMTFFATMLKSTFCRIKRVNGGEAMILARIN